MSVANRYKVITLSGSQCFAMLRALAGRETDLAERIVQAERNREGQELLNYLTNQLDDVRSTRHQFNETPFSEGAKS